MRIQLLAGTADAAGPLTVAGNMLKNEGLPAMYKGLSAALTRQVRRVLEVAGSGDLEGCLASVREIQGCANLVPPRQVLWRVAVSGQASEPSGRVLVDSRDEAPRGVLLHSRIFGTKRGRLCPLC